MRFIFQTVFFLAITTLNAQEFEYVYNQFERSQFNQVAPLQDKIFVAADIDGCPGGGFLMFDTMGNLLKEEILAGYYSITPGVVADPASGFVYTITYTNESEEFYDVNRFILTKINEEGNVVGTVTDTADNFNFRGSIHLRDSAIWFNDGTYLRSYGKDLKPIKQKDFGDMLEGPIAMAPVEREWIIYPTRNYQTAIIDTIIHYDPVNDTSTVIAIHPSSNYLSTYKNRIVLASEDSMLRLYHLESHTYTDSLYVGKWTDDSQLFDYQDKYYLFQPSEERLSFIAIELDSLHTLDTIYWDQPGLSNMIFSEDDKYLMLISAISVSSESYRPMHYPGIWRTKLTNGLPHSELDISLHSIDIIETWIPEDSCSLDCEFDREVAAEVSVTVMNEGVEPIHSFSYYSNSFGGSFCFSGRQSKYFEVLLQPGEVFTFKDTIEPERGPVRNIEYSAYIQAPNHRLESDTSNNSGSGQLYTTSLVDRQPALMQIFPNPVDTYLRLDPGVTLQRLEIYALDGRVVRVLDPARTEWHVGDLVPGFYHVVGAGKSQVFSAKMIKL